MMYGPSGFEAYDWPPDKWRRQSLSASIMRNVNGSGWHFILLRDSILFRESNNHGSEPDDNGPSLKSTENVIHRL